MRPLRDALADLPDAVFADLLERDDGYLLVVDLPGATAGTTDVRVEDHRLNVAARRKDQLPAGFQYRREGRDPVLSFDVPLSPDVDPDDAEARIERGVLEVELPRTVAGERTVPVE
jgi:HSP20 family molecular chaperone IbpA